MMRRIALMFALGLPTMASQQADEKAPAKDSDKGVDDKSTGEEWRDHFLKKYASPYMPMPKNASDPKSWRNDFVKEYAAPYMHYIEAQERAAKRNKDIPAEAEDCHTKAELRDWRDANRDEVRDYVPKEYRAFAYGSIDQEYEDNRDRIEAEEKKAKEARTNKTDMDTKAPARLELLAEPRGANSSAAHNPGDTYLKKYANEYVKNYAGGSVPVPLPEHADDWKAWRDAFVHKYAAPYEKYINGSMEVARNESGVPERAEDCNTTAELRRWRRAQLGVVDTYVPEEERPFVAGAIEQAYEGNKARIEKEKHEKEHEKESKRGEKEHEKESKRDEKKNKKESKREEKDENDEKDEKESTHDEKDKKDQKGDRKDEEPKDDEKGDKENEEEPKGDERTKSEEHHKAEHKEESKGDEKDGESESKGDEGEKPEDRQAATIMLAAEPVQESARGHPMTHSEFEGAKKALRREEREKDEALRRKAREEDDTLRKKQRDEDEALRRDEDMGVTGARHDERTAEERYDRKEREADESYRKQERKMDDHFRREEDKLDKEYEEGMQLAKKENDEKDKEEKEGGKEKAKEYKQAEKEKKKGKKEDTKREQEDRRAEKEKKEEKQKEAPKEEREHKGKEDDKDKDEDKDDDKDKDESKNDDKDKDDDSNKPQAAALSWAAMNTSAFESTEVFMVFGVVAALSGFVLASGAWRRHGSGARDLSEGLLQNEVPIAV